MLRYAESAGYSGLKRFPRAAIEYVGKSLTQYADAFTVQTNGMKEIMTRCGYNNKNISVVGNILDPNFETEARKQRKIIFVGRLRESKAPDMVIDAYARMPSDLKQDWDLELYGDGPMKNQLKCMIRKRDLDTVKITREPYNALPEVYDNAELLVHPSRYTEPFSRTWLEAMASKTAIVCSDHPSSRDVLGNIARFYDPFDAESLTQTLATVLTNASLRDDLVSKGRKKVDQYRAGVIIPKYIDVYDNIV